MIKTSDISTMRSTGTPDWELNTIIVGRRIRRDLGNLNDLMESIRAVGLLHPIVITAAGQLIAGQRRLEACRRLGWRSVPVHIVHIENVLRGQHDENVVRKNFLPSESVAIRQELLEYEREAARKRQGTRTDRLPANFAGSSFGSVRDRIASYTNVSGWTLDKAVKVVEAAEQNPDRYGQLVEQMDRTGRVDGVYRRLLVLQETERLASREGARKDIIMITGRDALTALRSMPAESVDCCVTSPPYWAARDYGVAGQLGLETHFDEYIRKLVDVFDEVRRVLKDTGTCWVVMGDTYAGSGKGYGGQDHGKLGTHANEFLPAPVKLDIADKSLLQIPARFALQMAHRGWILRNEIIWHKPNAIPSSVDDRFTVDFEKLFFFVKSQRYYFEQQLETVGTNGRDEPRCDVTSEQRNKRSVWSVPTMPYREAHFAAYPPELVTVPVRAGCPAGGVVLDPFMGSGTTAVVAQQLGRRFIGIDLNPNSLELTYKRLALSGK